MSRFKYLAVVAAVGMVVAACSSGDSDDTTTTEPTTTTEATTTTTAAPAEQSIAGIVASTDGFSTLLAAVEAAGLTETLDTGGPFTVFAPTDEAFAALPEGTLDALLADADALTDVLLYHVVEGAVMAADVVGLTSATTLQGSEITISVEGDSVVLNDSATVTATDVMASNGVIHVIDAVLLPPEG